MNKNNIKNIEKPLYILPQISKEQLLICKTIKKNKNALVDAVAGSGKTTTILWIAKTFPNFKILVITYNTKLQIETREKINELKLENITIYTYHSSGSNHYSISCSCDVGIGQIIHNDSDITLNNQYDLFIIDEIQDMASLYYELVCKIIRDTGKKTIDPSRYNVLISTYLVCLFGDRYQSIYAFNGADARFLTFGDKLFNTINNTCMQVNPLGNTCGQVNTFGNIGFNKLHLSTSYRMTGETADFINKCVLNNDRIKTIKHGPKPEYLIINTFRNSIVIVNRIKKYLESNLYKPDDIFILAPSIKDGKNTYIADIANTLCEMNIPVFKPNSDTGKLDENVIKGKLCLSTFCQAKGIERKIVIVCYFDNSYFQYYKQNVDTTICPNEIYVAVTRASYQLILIHNEEHDYLPFLKIDQLNTFANMSGKIKIREQKNNFQQKTSISEIVRYVPKDFSVKTMNKIIWKEQVYDCSEPIVQIAEKTLQQISDNGEQLYEDVTEISRQAILSTFEKRIKNIDTLNMEDLLFETTCRCADKTKYQFKIHQIENYDWITNIDLKDCINRLNYFISQNVELNNDANKINYEYNSIICSHTIECLDRENNELIIWDIICTNDEITSEQTIKLAITKYMLYLQDTTKIIHAKTLNVLNGEVYEIMYDENKMKDIINYLIDYKFNKKQIVLNDDEFLKENIKIKQKYFQ